MRMFSCGYEREELFRQREQPLQRPLNKKCWSVWKCLVWLPWREHSEGKGGNGRVILCRKDAMATVRALASECKQ